MNQEPKSEEYRKGWKECQEVLFKRFNDQLASGKNLRDEFAMASIGHIGVHAMQDEWAKGGPEWRLAAAQEAYKFADAMIEARKATA